MSKPDLYGYPVLMKAGLGNMLVPWAKCTLWCKDHDAQMIAPYWGKLRIGPFLRFERDKRQYQFLFHHGDHIAGARRMILLALSRSLDESEWQPETDRNRDGSLVVRFRNMDRADSLAGRHREVAQALRRITRQQFLPCDRSDHPFVGIHVRSGDFRTASESELRTGAHCRRIPIQWYVDTLLELRRSLGVSISATVFSDGDDAELSPLLDLANTTRYRDASAITEMLALSRASVVVASGSAFSMWGSYLGGAPTIWYPGQLFSMGRARGHAARDIEWDRGRLIDAGFVRLIRDQTQRV